MISEEEIRKKIDLIEQFKNQYHGYFSDYGIGMLEGQVVGLKFALAE